MKLNILGTGFYHPSGKYSNDDLAQVIDTSNEWIETRTGIKSRFFASDETTTDLAIKASLNAIQMAGIDANTIDLVICASITADDFTPSTACKLLEPLHIEQAMAFDINAACSGFLYGMEVASSLISVGQASRALVVGAEKMSKLLDFTDRNTAVLFGDGAGAIILEKGDIDFEFFSAAITDKAQSLYAHAYDRERPLSNECISQAHHLMMNGREVFRFAIDALAKGIEYHLKEQSLTINEIDSIIPHQANIRIIQSVAKKMQIPMDKFYLNLDQYGNTSAASIAIAFAEYLKENPTIKNMILVGFGAGLTWSSVLIKGKEKQNAN